MKKVSKSKGSKKVESKTPFRYVSKTPILFLIVALLVLWLAKSILVAATVNGIPVSRLALVNTLGSRYGSEVLEEMIDQTLVMREASKLGVKVTDEEIDAEISRLEELVSSQGLTLDQALESQGMTKKQLIDQIKLQKTVEAILKDKVVATDEEVRTYYDENKQYLDATKTFEEQKADLALQVAQAKLGSAYATWIEELRASAKIKYLIDF